MCGGGGGGGGGGGRGVHYNKGYRQSGVCPAACSKTVSGGAELRHIKCQPDANQSRLAQSPVPNKIC